MQEDLSQKKSTVERGAKFSKVRTLNKGFLAGFCGEGNGTHSSTLAWKIPWMEEPGGLQSMGSPRVGHD